jgi:hypothetical protein
MSMQTVESAELTTIDMGGPLVVASPADIISFYTDVATRLHDIVEKQGLFSLISGKKHLDAAAWETIIALDGAIPDIEWVKDIMDGDKLIGFKARATILKNGEKVGSGEMSCGLDDFPCRGKTGVAARRSGESTAQTWAIAKAGRLKYSWVVTLAGYDPLPTNEAMDIIQQPQQPTQRREQPAAPAVPPKDYGAIIRSMRENLPVLLTSAQFDGAMTQLDLSTSNVTDILGTDLISYVELTPDATNLMALEVILTALNDKLKPATQLAW